jgi:hypothetical protein
MAARAAESLRKCFPNAQHETVVLFSSKLTEMLVKAYDVFRRIGAGRFTLYIARRIAAHSVITGKYDQALK